MYNYREEMIKDIKAYVVENKWVEENYENSMDYYDMLDLLYDEVWDKDEVTGNGVEFYASEEECMKMVMENLPLYFEAARELNDFPVHKSEPWEQRCAAQHMDATIRCYLLRDCLEEACEQL